MATRAAALHGSRHPAWSAVASHRPTWPVLAVLATLGGLYVPMLQLLARYHWASPAHSHGPLVLLAALALFAAAAHRYRSGVAAAAIAVGSRSNARSGTALVLVGLALYVPGMVTETALVAVLSLFPLITGLSLCIGGTALLRQQGFAYFFLLFLVPWPTWATDPLMQPMKLAVSWSAEHLLHALRYAVARDGVLLDIGSYRLLVADACAGMNSLFMLESFGLLYLHVLRHTSVLRNAVLALLIVPISFGANVLRVLSLALLTFHFGDEAGQGFLHGFSGLLLFTAALLLLAPADALLRRLSRGFGP